MPCGMCKHVARARSPVGLRMRAVFRHAVTMKGVTAMFAGSSRSKETTTLHWKMSDAAWVHWAQGRGEKSVRDVVLERVEQLRSNPEAVRACCEAIAQETPPGEHEVGRTHEIRIHLPASDWAEAIQRVGSVSTEQLLGALILESESWRQVGNADSEFGAGWHALDLVSSLGSLTATTAGLSLGREEKILARMVAWAAIIGATAAVTSAVAAWCSP